MKIFYEQPDYRCDMSVSCIDVGFDLRTQGMAIELDGSETCVGYSTNANPSQGRIVIGTAREIARVLRSEGYTVKVAQAAER